MALPRRSGTRSSSSSRPLPICYLLFLTLACRPYLRNWTCLQESLQGVPCPRRLGWVDLDLGSSPGWWTGTVATYLPSRVVEHPKSKSTQPSLRGQGTPCREGERRKIRPCHRSKNTASAKVRQKMFREVAELERAQRSFL